MRPKLGAVVLCKTTSIVYLITDSWSEFKSCQLQLLSGEGWGGVESNRNLTKRNYCFLDPVEWV